MKYTINFGKTNISFSLKRKQRKTLAIHVYPDKQIEVIAPMDSSLERIYEKVRKRAPWIIRKQIEFDRIQPQLPKPLYLSGETYRFLGRQYRLKIFQGRDKDIYIHDGFLILTTLLVNNSHQIEKKVIYWYRKQAKNIFNKRFKECMKNVNKIGIMEIPEWSLRIMSKRWGSCTKKGKILLHPELVAAPEECIDYVIIHELCHLIEHNHSPRFYEMLEIVLPDWKKRKAKLDETIEIRLM